MRHIPLAGAVVAKLKAAFTGHMRASLVSFHYSLTSLALLVLKLVLQENVLELLAFAMMRFHFAFKAINNMALLTFTCF